MKSKIHLAGIVGLVLIGVGVIVTLTGGINIQNRFKYNENFPSIKDTDEIIFLLYGVANLLIGAALLGKASWSIGAAKALCIFSLLGWLYLVVDVFVNEVLRGSDFWILAGISFASFGFLIVEFLFLLNPKLVDDMKESETENWDDEILDA